MAEEEAEIEEVARASGERDAFRRGCCAVGRLARLFAEDHGESSCVLAVGGRGWCRTRPSPLIVRWVSRQWR